MTTVKNVPHTINRPGTHEHPDLYGYVGGIVAFGPENVPSSVHVFPPPREHVHITFKADEFGVVRSSHEVLAIHSYQYNMKTFNPGRLANLE